MSIILELILAFEINNRLSNLTIEPVLVSNRPDCYLFKNVFDTIFLIQFPRYISDTYCIEDFKSVNSVLDIPQHAILVKFFVYSSEIYLRNYFPPEITYELF